MNLVVAAVATIALSLPPALAEGADQQKQQGQAAGQQRQQQMSAQDRSAAMLEDRVFVRLAEEAWAGGDFDVQVDGNTVTLSGTVPSEQTKQRMLRVARQTLGVTEVRDQMQVNPAAATASAATTVPDQQLAQRVAQKIAANIPAAKAGEDWWLMGWRVEGPDNRWTFTVEAENGNIWLDGEVPRYRHIREAIEAARDVQGVRSVRSNLEIEPVYYAYPAYDPVYGRYYPGYGYPGYGYPPRAYVDPDYNYFVTVRDDMDAHGFRGLHAMTGEVTKLDKQKGRLSLKTQEGTLDLHFPPSALQNVQQGDRITVELGMKAADRSPAASPRTGSDTNRSMQDRSGAQAQPEQTKPQQAKPEQK